MYEIRELPPEGSRQPHRLHAPRAALWTRAYLLGGPLLISCHWHLRMRRSVPHLTVGCPLCLEKGPIEQYGQAFVPAAIHQRSQADAIPSRQDHWSQVVLTLPEHVASELSRMNGVGRDWRGCELDLWHPQGRDNAPLALAFLGRHDASQFPPGWDVRLDLDYAWRDWLALAQDSLSSEEPPEREPGEEG